MSDSDSAPEDVTFEAARAVALSHIKDATKAIEEQREKTKNARKRKMEFLKQQRENKLQRMKVLESHKLPEEFLEDLATSEPTTDENPVTDEKSVTEEKQTYDRFVANDDFLGRIVALSQEAIVQNTRKVSDGQPKEKKTRHNTRKVFDDQPKEKKINREKIIETKNTEFKIVTKDDLSSSQYRNTTAFNFREAMLNDPKRVKREPHRMKQVRDNRKKIAGIQYKY